MNNQTSQQIRIRRGKSVIGGIILIFVLALAVTQAIQAQSGSGQVDSPQIFASTGTINFQGELTDNASGATIPDGSYNLRFAIYDASSGGERIWPVSSAYEEQTAVSVANGLFNVQLGAIDAITPGVFAGGDRYLQIWACTTAGISCTTYDDLGRLPISSAAYAQNLAAGSSIEGSSNSLLSLYGSDTGGSVLTVSSSATTGNASGVYGSAASSGGAGVSGYNGGGGYGVYGGSTSGIGVYGSSTSSSGVVGESSAFGVTGITTDDNGRGVYGFASSSGIHYGVYGRSASNQGFGVYSEGNVGIQGNLITTGTVESTLDGFKFPDGSIQTTAADQRPGFGSSILDSAGIVGSNPDVTIGTNGLPVIAYTATSDHALKVAACKDLACQDAVISVVDSATPGSPYYLNEPSIVIGASGFPLISYDESEFGDLMLAVCNDQNCASATTIIVDSSRTAYDSSIAVGSDGYPIISYYDGGNEDLLVAHCNNANCTSPTITTIDSAGNVGVGSEIVIGADGLPIISYYDFDDQQSLNVASCHNVACTSATIQVIHPWILSTYAPVETSMVIGIDGMPVITYAGVGIVQYAQVTHCNTITCTTTTPPLSLGNTHKASLAIGADGMPVISYGGSNGLEVIHCSDVACSSSTTVVNNSVDVSDPAITIGVDGMPLIAHYTDSNDDLGVTHCSNRFCVPYARP